VKKPLRPLMEVEVVEEYRNKKRELIWLPFFLL
jgi:hypothetical protein